MAQRPAIPERYSSLLPASQRAILNERKNRIISQSSILSNMSVASTSVSDFLEAKIKGYQTELDYLETYKESLITAHVSETITTDQYKENIDEVFQSYDDVSQDLRVLKRQHKIIKEDLEDEIVKRRRKNNNAPGIDFFERAYAETIGTRVMGAVSKQKKQKKFNQSAFRKAVLEYYSAIDNEKELAYCHLLGWLTEESIKAAHLVPKSLSGNEIAHLFGTKDFDVKLDPRNGISLHKKIEQGLDEGAITIIPVPSNEASITQWKCLLLDTERSKKTVCWVDRHTEIKWRDIDGQQLIFRSDNRPANRYLYFRFVITYLHMKRSNNIAAAKIEAKQIFFASPGPYLHESTLISLARNISGCELPPSVFSECTFADQDEGTQKGAEKTATILAARLRSATIESAKEREEEIKALEEGFESSDADTDKSDQVEDNE